MIRTSMSFLLALAVAALAGCGGGGGGAAGTSAASGVAPAAAVQTITGTAATGLPLANALVTIKDSTGTTASGTATATGTFSIPVTGMTPPFMLQAASSTLGVYNLYSVLPALSMTTTSTANVNITPITTLVMYELNQGVDPGNMFRTTGFAALTSAAVGNAETTVRNRLATSLTTTPSAKLAAVSTGFSMMYGSFAVGDVYDVALDNVGKITAYSAGGATLQVTGQASTTYTTTAVSSTPTAKSVQLLLSSTQMDSSGLTPITLTAVVLDSNKQTVVGRTVTFSTTDPDTTPTAYISNVSGVSGANGQAGAASRAGGGVSDANGVVTAKLNLGTTKSNRIISVIATVDGISTPPATVNVKGTNLAMSGNTSLALNATSALTIILKDSVGTPVPGVQLGVTSGNGNPIALTPSTGITDVNGQITAAVTATKAGTGTDLLTVAGAGASQTQTLTINSASFAFTAPVIVAPATTPEILVNTSTPVKVHWDNGGTPVADGTVVSFYTSRGAFVAPGTAKTLGGNATLNVLADSTGATIITASGPGGTPAATLNVVFITTSASSITAQASPSTVAVNTGAGTTNQSVISVIVRDANLNLVKNAHVIFSQVTDPSGGSLAANTAITDITGTASVNYIAGTTTTTQQNGVKINATVDTVNGVAIPPINLSPPVTLTVASQALYVRLGTDNIVYHDTPVPGTYTKQYTALVSDAAGNPAPDGTQVRFVLRPRKGPAYSFYKGYYTYNPANKIWVQTVTASCVSEDANSNGMLDSGEDLNGNGFLDPVGVATVNTTATTVGGFAIAKIVYPKDHATWVDDELEARAGTIGNDPPDIVTVPLANLAADYLDPNISPPGMISPYGQGGSCNDTK